MAKTKAVATEARTAPIDVVGDQALALASAFDGIVHLFGGRVDSFDVSPDGLVARGFSVNEPYNAETILSDISARVKRPQLWPTLAWITGIAPAHFASNQALTAYGVQYFKGTPESGTTKSPQYFRDAAAAYRTAMGIDFAKPRGRARKNLVLKLSEITPESLASAGLTSEQIEQLIAVATKMRPVTQTVSAETVQV